MLDFFWILYGSVKTSVSRVLSKNPFKAAVFDFGFINKNTQASSATTTAMSGMLYIYKIRWISKNEQRSKNCEALEPIQMSLRQKVFSCPASAQFKATDAYEHGIKKSWLATIKSHTVKYRGVLLRG